MPTAVGSMSGVRAAARRKRRRRIPAAERLALLETLSTQADAAACGDVALGWLLRFAGIAKGLVIARASDGGPPITLAARGIDAAVFHAVPLAGPKRAIPLGLLLLAPRKPGPLHPQIAWVARALTDRLLVLGYPSSRPSHLLASRSHELRTPLNVILGYTELLLDGVGGAVSDEQRKRLERIESSGRQLLAIIDDLLEITNER